jgi:cyanate permease
VVEEDRRAEDPGHRGLKTSNWTAVWAMFAGGVACGAFMGKVPPALPEIRGELALTLVQSGFIATMINLMGALVGILMGTLCDRLGHKRLGLLGLAVLTAGGFLGATADAYPLLLASRFLEGTGFILFTVTAAALINGATATPQERNRAMGLWTAYMPTGATLAMLSAPLALAHFGWRGLWTALAAAALAALLLVWRSVPPTRAGSVGTLRLVAESLRQPGAWLLALIFAFYVAQWTSVMIWLPTFVVDQRGGTPAAAALLGAFMVLANVPGNIAGGLLLGRGVRRSTLVITASAVSALCFAGMLGEWLPDAARYLLVLVYSCCAGMIPACALSGIAVHARSPGHIATTNGMVMQAAQIGQSIGPILLAWLASRFGGWSVTLWAMLAFAAAGALCGRAIGRIEQRKA